MNFVLIVIDGLRADRLSCYGYRKATSPTMDSLTEGGILFHNFFTPVTPTQPAITTLFTGQFPITHGIVAQSGRHSLDRKAPWLPEILRRRGFSTVAVDSLASEKRWFSRGFDTILDARKQFGSTPDCFQVNSLATQWLQKRQAKPFFLFLHYYETHTPYLPLKRYLDLFYQNDPTSNRGSLDPFYRRPLKPDLITDWLMPFAQGWPGARGEKIEDIEFIRALYDAAIRTADDGISQMMEDLQRLKLLDDTVMVILADHGQELGEHGIYFEQHGLYESTIHVPLIINWPQQISPGIRVDSIQQLPDVAPTILDLAGCGTHPDMQGRSLVPHFIGSGKNSGYDSVLAAECTWMAKWAYRTHRHKLIVAREPDFYGKPTIELYDLTQDPGEQHNIAGVEISVCRSLRQEMERAIRSRLPAGWTGEDPVARHGIVRGLHSYHNDKTLREFKRPLLSGLAYEFRRKSSTHLRFNHGLPDVISEWRYPEFKACLDELTPLIGANHWRLDLLSRQAQTTRVFPTRLYGMLRRLSRRQPPRPYFVGMTSGGVLFLGDFRDPFSVASAVVPDFNHTVTEFLRRAARNNQTGFLDVGTNLGIVAATVARELRGYANVYAFEPLPETARRAAATFALNRLTNVRLYPCAAGKTDGIVDLHHVPGRSAIASLNLTGLLKEHQRIITTRVAQRSLDSIRQEFQWDEIGLVKIDVEGSELDVLEGAGVLIDSLRPSILYENNPGTTPDQGTRHSRPMALLTGYIFKGLQQNGSLSEYHEEMNDEHIEVWCVPER